MKPPLILAVFCLAAGWAQAQGTSDLETSDRLQRARLAAERKAAETAFQAQEKACYGKFSVTHCIDAARTQRRAALADLRRQEIALNDAERRRKAAERLRIIEQNTAAQSERDEAEQRAKAAPAGVTASGVRPAGQASASRSAADRAPQAPGGRGEPRVEQAQAKHDAVRQQKAQESARNLQRHQARMAEAEKRKSALARRLAERKKPLAQPLPPSP